jgi:hypothetical protein
MNSQDHEYIRSISEIVPNNNTLTSSFGKTESTNYTWLIIIILLAFFGVNIFVYLAIGTEETINILKKVFGPILSYFGYATLTTAKQTVETTATGAKSGIDSVSNITTGAIDNVLVEGQYAKSSLPVQSDMQQTGAKIEKWQQDALAKALTNVKNDQNIVPDDSRSSIQTTTGKSGWCYIGEEQGIRSCSQIGVNDVCMSGDIFPTQDVCMNPNLRV